MALLMLEKMAVLGASQDKGGCVEEAALLPCTSQMEGGVTGFYSTSYRGSSLPTLLTPAMKT